MKSIIIYTSVFFLLCTSSFAQVDTTTVNTENSIIALKRKVTKEAVVLRWAPSDYFLFTHGTEVGYEIKRRAYSANPEEDFSSTTDVDQAYKTIATVRPWTRPEWEANALDKEDIYAGVGMQTLFGGDLSQNAKGDVGEIADNIENQQRQFVFAILSADFSRTAALGLGLRYEDTDVKSGYYYEYMITFTSLPEGLEVDTAFVVADMDKPTKPKKVDHCFLEAGDNKMSIYWTRHNDQFFTAYDVERSMDGTSWQKLNKRPWMTSRVTEETPNFFVDSLENNTTTYMYRLRGYNSFGEMGEYSDIMNLHGEDETPPNPAWAVSAEDLGGYVVVKWNAQPIEPDFDGFYVERSAEANGLFERISEKLPSDAREFADIMPAPLESNYYRITTTDKSGNESHSFSDLGYIIDSMPPAKPIGLMGKIDTAGVVELDWSPGQEADIIGYRVYWSNNKDQEFTQLMGDVIPGINYVDSIAVKTLNEEIYYRIAAVDHRFNHSEMSDILTLKKPDLVPPSAPVIYKYETNEGRIELNWYPSVSEDVVSQKLLKNTNNEGWKQIEVLNDKAQKEWKDSKVSVGNHYAYKIVATDDAKNVTESNVLEIMMSDQGLKVTEVEPKLSVTNTTASLTWISSPEKAKYVIYKVRNDKISRLVSLYAPNSHFDDQAYLDGDTYQMRIVYSDGNESQLIVFK